MFIRFLKFFNKSIQFRTIIWLLILGILSYILDRRSGPGAVSDLVNDTTTTWFWHIICLVCIVMLLVVLPLFSIWREKFLPEVIYQEKKISADPSVSLQKIAEVFNLDHDVLRNQFPEEMTKQHVILLIKKYFI